MSNKETLNWNLLQSGQALDKTAAWKLSNANAVFVGIRSCCLLPSHWNNFEDQVRAVGDTCPGDRRRHSNDICAVKCVFCYLHLQLRRVRTIRRSSRVFAVQMQTRRQGDVCEWNATARGRVWMKADDPLLSISRMLHRRELLYPAVGKEETAIIEGTRKRRLRSST